MHNKEEKSTELHGLSGIIRKKEKTKTGKEKKENNLFFRNG